MDPIRLPERPSAGDILRLVGVSDAPVDPVYVASSFRVPVRLVSGTEWEGAVDMGHGGQGPVIYVRDGMIPERQRFTVAHELGHFFLHRHLQQAFRDYASSQGGDPHEVEANRFAAELLMPAPWVQAYAMYEDESQLARRFQVSNQAMSIRLTALHVRPLHRVERIDASGQARASDKIVA